MRPTPQATDKVGHQGEAVFSQGATFDGTPPVPAMDPAPAVVMQQEHNTLGRWNQVYANDDSTIGRTCEITHADGTE